MSPKVMRASAVGALAVLVLAGCGDTAAPADVKAAQGCKLALNLLQDVTGSSTDMANANEAKLQPIAEDLLSGTAEAKAQGKPLPKWSTLGAAFVSDMADANTGDLQAFAKDQDTITAECTKIPDVAKQAGGFTK